MNAGCEWPVSFVGCDGCAEFDGLEKTEQALVTEMAVDLLWEWTNRVFGVCDVEVRPCRVSTPVKTSTFVGRGPFTGLGGRAFYPVLIAGTWHNITCGCLGQCSCDPSGPTVISLPGPVVSITEVTVDGVIVPSGSYRLDQNRWLIRTDGEVWPATQDMLAAPDAEGSFLVTYKRGIPVPAGGQISAGRLAAELAKALCGKECVLPERLQTITRQGLTVGINTTEEAWVQTGIWFIDNWIDKVNRPRSFASVTSVDVR